ncbi:succinate dehydrogenase assembly factor 2 [Chitinibacter fontanus]|uniref:FAD assembly factor SdhE n=1 Tax=Chitinibacter fontanus TaxID=1737446 RepID=A0A7D5V7M5_9NEIS|nr:succinate dehydrogenase assembly factor 2 [Chitinibacter fontanus]QLI80296.1 succinate dehydrogenase assembly factor 2 [Chitinibacter fontanus]
MDEVELKRIIWRSRRGLLELDLQLERFVNEVLPTLNEQELAVYEQILMLPDWDFLEYVNGKSVCPDPELAEMIARIAAANAGSHGETNNNAAGIAERTTEAL